MSRMWNFIAGSGSEAAGGAVSGKAPFLYFGLPSNVQQESVVAMLEENGCAVLVGPPGTGKSQTIANVICHYLALGRRVLVTSKGEPATEVLRNKLPEGIRELCVSLGSGDTASFRRLEGAVESLANHVAAAPLSELKAVADRLRRRFEAISNELEELEAAEASYGSIYFPPTDAVSHPLEQLTAKLNSQHLEVLGVPTTATMQQLADVVSTLLRHPQPSSSTPARAASPSSLPARAFFLEDDEAIIDPARSPPSQELVIQLRNLRRRAGDALFWGDELESRSAQANHSEACDVQTFRELATELRHRSDLAELVKKGDLPSIANRGKATKLEYKLTEIMGSMEELQVILRQLDTGVDNVRASPRASPGWVFELFRHAGNARCQRVMQKVRLLVDRLDDMYSRGSEEGLDVFVPTVLLQMIEIPLPKELVLAVDGSDIDIKVVGNGEFATEIRWRAHPNNRGMMSSLWRATPSQTLLAELSEVRFEGRAPVGAHEWEIVEQYLVRVSCAARLREEWSSLSTLANNVPDLPRYRRCSAIPCDHDGNELGAGTAAPGSGKDAFVEFVQSHKKAINLGATVMYLADGLGDMAAESHGKALGVLNALSRGPEACQVELSNLRRSLEIDGSTLSDKEAAKADLLSDFGLCEEGSPVDKLRRATECLGALELPPGEVTRNWQLARNALRDARSCLVHAKELRELANRELKHIAPTWARRITMLEYPATATPGKDTENDRKRKVACFAAPGSTPLDPIPSDSQRLWSAIAVKKAMTGFVGDAGPTGESAATQRLLAQRDASVQALVAAVAKEALREAMSAETCAGLIRLVSAVAAAGRAEGDQTAPRARRLKADLAAAMEDCANAVPCWIMPTWRISQCLPAEIGCFDLVILDEASQSDLTAMTALLRGKRILVVGDQKQVSPTAAFIAESKIVDLKSRLFASRHPYVEQLLPGRSIFDLAQTCYANARVALTQHFRCVPQCISYSNDEFYHGKLQPRRLPPQSERLSPALIDVFVKGGKKKGKINEVEAQALVDYLKDELSDSSKELVQRRASIGIISLLGIEQTRLIRRLLLEALTDTQLATHAIVVGDPSGFQGDEKDVVLLSMICSPKASPTQVGRMYEQRYNVALSRARDRMVLFRSLNPVDISNREDLKLSTMNFFMKMSSSDASGGAAKPRKQHQHLFTDSTVEGQVFAWLDSNGYQYDSACSIGGSIAVLEDVAEDRRLCLCLDGGNGTNLHDWRMQCREQRVNIMMLSCAFVCIVLPPSLPPVLRGIPLAVLCHTSLFLLLLS